MGSTRARSRLASQDGFGLIEVVISAAVLVVVVLGTLAALDAVSSAASGNKARTVAAALAEKDQERLRTFRTTDLHNLSSLELGTKPVQVGAVTYTVKSEAKLVTDSTGDEVSCALSPDNGSYLRIISTVTAPGLQNPVVLSGLVAPRPGQGTLTGLVKNRHGDPVANVTVTATGMTPGVRETNEAGCAVFNEREAGSYVLQLGEPGWVDPSGNPAPQKSATVSAGNLTMIEFVYDQAITFNVETKTFRPPSATPSPDPSTGVIAAHTGMPIGFKQLTPTAPATTATSFSFTSMFPFETPYQVYGGNCSGADPSRLIGTYFATHTEALSNYSTPPLQVYEPSIDVLVKSTAGANQSNARVYAYPKSTGCSTTRIQLGVTGATGEVATLDGLPFGTYDICADWRPNSSTTRSRVAHYDLNNSSYLGTPLTVTLPAAQAGGCGNTTPTT